MDATWQSSSEGTDDSDNEVRQSRRRPARAGAFTRGFLQANCADLSTDGVLTSSLLWKMAERTRPGSSKSLLVLFAKKLAHELESQLNEKAELYAQVEASRSSPVEPFPGPRLRQESAKGEEDALPRHLSLVQQAQAIAERITQDKTEALLIHDQSVAGNDELDVRASLSQSPFLTRSGESAHTASAPTLEKQRRWATLTSSNALARTKSTVSLHSIHESTADLFPSPTAVQLTQPPPPNVTNELNMSDAVRLERRLEA